MPEPLARGGEEFLLRVKGDSMVNAGILEATSSSCAAAGRARRRHRGRAGRRRRDGRRGDGQDLLPRGRPCPAAARERRAGADLRRPRRDPRSSHRSLAKPGMSVSSFARTLDQELPGARARRQPGVPRVRRVRAARAQRRDRLRRMRLEPRGRPGGRGRAAAATAPAGRCVEELLAQRRRLRLREQVSQGYTSPCRPVTAGLSPARGKSGHHRAGRWGNPRRRKPTDSGTERRPPAGRLAGSAGRGERVR